MSTDWAVPYRRLHEAIGEARRLVDAAGLDQPVIYGHAGNGRHRLPLTEVPSSHGQPGPLNPGPPGPDHDPLRLLLLALTAG